ncbi:hypothetical protein BCR44DRAFT_1284800 [Catenaria anguillulae PL171]|uniref:Secreted protein n=1 Tax=Catenaria anguillulae PL171 TaxID=765915 RepID=A0A1Y2HYZ7_9FUNG|nr:hypothetical protein BCR44DRAFT_1284800 [Catenaria anguillulae PL171]
MRTMPTRLSAQAEHGGRGGCLLLLLLLLLLLCSGRCGCGCKSVFDGIGRRLGLDLGHHEQVLLSKLGLLLGMCLLLLSLDHGHLLLTRNVGVVEGGGSTWNGAGHAGRRRRRRVFCIVRGHGSALPDDDEEAEVMADVVVSVSW